MRLTAPAAPRGGPEAPAGGMGLFDLDRIEATLRTMADPGHWESLPDVLNRLLVGYRYVDRLLVEGVELLDLGQSRHLLELNHIVLCGTSPKTRAEAADHLAETERVFYEGRPGGIADFNDWRERNRGLAGAELAAACFVRIVSSPQLYVEGNQRTGMLVASYVLARAGAPPLVLSAATKPEAARLFGEIKECPKTRLVKQPRLWKLQRRLTAFIVASADPALLA